MGIKVKEMNFPRNGQHNGKSKEELMRLGMDEWVADIFHNRGLAANMQIMLFRNTICEYHNDIIKKLVPDTGIIMWTFMQRNTNVIKRPGTNNTGFFVVSNYEIGYFKNNMNKYPLFRFDDASIEVINAIDAGMYPNNDVIVFNYDFVKMVNI